MELCKDCQKQVQEVMLGKPPILVKYRLDVAHGKRITFLMLGDREKGFIPPLRMLQEFKQQVDEALKGKGHPVIITHPFLSTLQVDVPEDSTLYIGYTK